MKNQEKPQAAEKILQENILKYSDNITMDYYGFRLKSLAQKIKSECLKLKKDTRLSNI